MWLLASVNYLCLERAFPVGFRCFGCCFCCFFFFSFSLESSIRVLSFFREVFVMFSLKIRPSFAPRRVASYPCSILCLMFFVQREELPYVSKSVVDSVVAKMGFYVCSFGKNHTFFVFLASDSISQPHGERDFALHCTIYMEMGSSASLFLFCLL
jgi:hypothetical protein